MLQITIHTTNEVGPSEAEPAITTRASLGALSDADFARSPGSPGQDAMNPGSQESPSPGTTPASSRLLTGTVQSVLMHVANCSACQARPERLLSLSRMLAQAADGLMSTSVSVATSSSVESAPDAVTSGLRESIERSVRLARARQKPWVRCTSMTILAEDTFPILCREEEGHVGPHKSYDVHW